MRDLVHLRALLNAFAQIFLQRHHGCGALIMLALAIGAPALLAGAVLGVLAAHTGAFWLGYQRADRSDGLYGYNAALLGALLVQLYGLSVISVAVLMLAALLSCPLQSWLIDRLRHRAGLPGFTFPFVLIGFVVLAATPAQPSPVLDAPPPDAMALLDAWLLGVGQVVFVSHPLAAACMVAAIAWASVRDALWLLAGSALGLSIGVSLGIAWQDGLAGFNPALAGLALAQWRGGWRLPVLGMVIAVAIWLICRSLGLPTLTLPFLLATWLGLRIQALRPSHSS